MITLRIHAGFSLIELLSVMGIASVLLSLAVPGYRKFVLDGQRAAVVNELLTSVQLARTRAMTRGGYVTLCPSVDGVTCAASSDAWSSGWLVYDNRDREFIGIEPDPGETVLRYSPSPSGAARVSSGGRRAFSFRPFQLNSDNGTLTVCDARGTTDPEQRRAIILNTAGRPRTSTRKSDGTLLDCP